MKDMLSLKLADKELLKLMFEVSGQRASEINEELKQFVSNNSDNNEVSGYMGGMYCSGLGPNRQVRKGATCENFWGGSVQYDGKKWSRI